MSADSVMPVRRMTRDLDAQGGQVRVSTPEFMVSVYILEFSLWVLSFWFSILPVSIDDVSWVQMPARMVDAEWFNIITDVDL